MMTTYTDQIESEVMAQTCKSIYADHENHIITQWRNYMQYVKYGFKDYDKNKFTAGPNIDDDLNALRDGLLYKKDVTQATYGYGAEAACDLMQMVYDGHYNLESVWWKGWEDNLMHKIGYYNALFIVGQITLSSWL